MTHVKTILAGLAWGLSLVIAGLCLGVGYRCLTQPRKPVDAIDVLTQPSDSDPVVGEVWYDPTDCREQNPFEPRPQRRCRVLEVRGDWVQYEFNGGSDGKLPVVSSTRVGVFKSLYRRSQ